MVDRVSVALWETLPSTQEMALSLLDPYLEEKLIPPEFLVVSRVQMKGRGRDGNRWISPEGGYYASLVVRVDNPDLSGLPLKTGIALSRFIADLYGLKIQLSWPNDLYTEKKKIAGILVNARGGIAVIGMGINLDIPPSRFSDEGLENAASLNRFPGNNFSFDSFHEAFSTLFIKDLAADVKEPLDRAAWEERSLFSSGDPISWTTNGIAGEGTYEGIAQEGYLKVRAGGQLQEIVSASNIRERRS